MEGFLGLLVKLVHYNSAYLEEDVLTYLVSHTCSHVNQSTNPSETEVHGNVPLSFSCFILTSILQLCLAFLDAVICYSAFPPSTVHPCVITLCHTLNIERFIQLSLEVALSSQPPSSADLILSAGNAATARHSPWPDCYLYHVQCPTGQVRQSPLVYTLYHSLVYIPRFHAGDVLLLRGAVFYISMSLWGVKKVESLSLPFTAVLPAIHQV